MTGRDPFHDGERWVQERAGERGIALRVGGMVGPVVPPRALPFLAEQRMLAMGSVDEEGSVFASVVLGAAGLASSEDGSTVVVDRTRVESSREDPLWRHLGMGAPLGLLAIELGSRRRLRVNGVVSGLDERRMVMTVTEAYPNCPKYIQRRLARDDPSLPAPESGAAAGGPSLDGLRIRAIERADTLFVASRHPTRGLDVSHRGGPPGFVRVLDPSRLRIPDYPGNSMFNTLGNFVVDDRAGLAVLDFERRRILQMTGRVVVGFGQDEDPRQPTGGTGRYWDFRATRWLELPLGGRLTWDVPDGSPHHPAEHG